MQIADFKGVVYLSKQDYEDLITNGSITKDGQTLVYDRATIYMTDDTSLEEYTPGSNQWDTTPTQNSTKPVISGGVYNSVNDKVDKISKPTRAKKEVSEDE